MQASLKSTYIILFTLLTICLTIGFFFNSSTQWLQELPLDLAAEIIGILLVVFSIDSVLDAEQEKERERREAVAFQQLHRPLNRHFLLLFSLFKAAAAGKPEREYQDMTDFFDDFYYQQIAFLDFSKKVSIAKFGETTWSSYISWECWQLHETLNRTVEKYALVLQPDTIDLIEELNNSPFIWLTLQSARMYQIETRLPNHNQTNEPLLLEKLNSLGHKEIYELVKEHITLFLSLIELYNENVAPSDRLRWQSELWLEASTPPLGSGRLEV
jgi:acyl-CoA-binding protein